MTDQRGDISEFDEPHKFYRPEGVMVSCERCDLPGLEKEMTVSMIAEATADCPEDNVLLCGDCVSTCEDAATSALEMRRARYAEAKASMARTLAGLA